MEAPARGVRHLRFLDLFLGLLLVLLLCARPASGLGQSRASARRVSTTSHHRTQASCHATCDRECLKTVSEAEERPVCTCACCKDRTGFLCWSCDTEKIVDPEPERCQAFWHVAQAISQDWMMAPHHVTKGRFPYGTTGQTKAVGP